MEVPDFTGKTLEEATAQIEKDGFTLGPVDYQFSDVVEANKVMSQTPRAGTRQEKGTKVNLVVSQGIEQVAVDESRSLAPSYDLQGRPLPAPRRGQLFIRDGRKMMLR